MGNRSKDFGDILIQARGHFDKVKVHTVFDGNLYSYLHLNWLLVDILGFVFFFFLCFI